MISRWPSRWDPRTGRWKLSQLIREFFEQSYGPVDVDALLRHLKDLGFYIPTTRRILPEFVEIDGAGCVRFRKRESRMG